MKLSEMKEILASGGIQLTKSLGQNFLHDANQIRRIIEAGELTRADRVLEIGPGLGPLTESLVACAGEVLAIEKDARLVEVLSRRLLPALAEGKTPGAARLRLLHDDALDYLQRETRDWSGWKLVANLPYSVASPILAELALAPHPPQRLVATLQLEVAKRLMTGPGNPDYGVLTLLVQLDFEPLTWFKIPASCFFPEPDVDSACVCLARRTHRLEPGQRETFVRLVKRGFSQRRKMLLKLLKTEWPAEPLAEACAGAGLAPAVRAEEVSREQFIRLAERLTPDSSRA